MNFQVSDWDSNDLGNQTHSNLFKETKVKPNQKTITKIKNKSKIKVTTKTNDLNAEISNSKKKVKKIAWEKNKKKYIKKNLNHEGKNVPGTQIVDIKILTHSEVLNESQIKAEINKKRNDKKKLKKLNMKKLQREQKLQNTEKFEQKKQNTSQKTETKIENIENPTKVKRNKKKKVPKNKLENVENKIISDESIVETTLNDKKNEKKLKKKNTEQNIQETPQKDKNTLKKALKRLQHNNLKNIPLEESVRDVKAKNIKKENKKQLPIEDSEEVIIINEEIDIDDLMMDKTLIKLTNQLKEEREKVENLKNVQSETTDLENDAQSNQNKIQPPKHPLRERMLKTLKAARFRFINEQIYTNVSKEAQKLFQEDPEAFKAYHDGYRQQVAKWPVNPLDIIIKAVKKMPSDYEIADFGCGEARLAKSVPHKVYSFDLVSNDPDVVACDMAHIPLKKNKVDVVVFCLSLMGTNLKDYLFEANRVLKVGGVLKIAEIESRFEGVDQFIEGLIRYGFTNTWTDLSHNLFYFLNFKKERDIAKKNKLPTITLNPCLYKKR